MSPGRCGAWYLAISLGTWVWPAGSNTCSPGAWTSEAPATFCRSSVVSLLAGDTICDLQGEDWGAGSGVESSGELTLVCSRSSFSEAAAWLPSAPRRSPAPPADPRRAAGLQKGGPSAACLSDICSRRGELLRSWPLAAPETAEGEASAAAESRAEPSGARGRKERRGGDRLAARALACGSWRREHAGAGSREITACFLSPVFTLSTCKDRQNLGKIQDNTAGNRGIHRDVIGSCGC